MKIKSIDLSLLFDIRETKPDNNSHYEIVTTAKLENMLERTTEEFMEEHAKTKHMVFFYKFIPCIAIIVQMIGLIIIGRAMSLELLTSEQYTLINLGLMFLVLFSIYLWRKNGSKMDKKIVRELSDYIKLKKNELYSVKIILKDASSSSYQAIVDILDDNNIELCTKTDELREKIEVLKEMLEQNAINLEDNTLQIWCMKKNIDFN